MSKDKSREWYKDWFDENYLLLYNHRNNSDAFKQAKLIISTIDPDKGDKILDLACGNGRHCRIFQDMGFDISGLDLSVSLIKNGKKADKSLSLVVGDMREIPGKYDIILSLFTSFGYFQEDEENKSVIKSVSNSLNPGGWFWLDFLNPYFVKENLIPESRRKIGDDISVIESRMIDSDVVRKDIEFNKGGQIKMYSEIVKLYPLSLLKAFFTGNGIDVAGVFGDYSGSKWTESSPRTIVYGKKNNE